MTLVRALEELGRDASEAVAVIGDLMLDHYLVGSSERISPEGPVPVVLIETESSRLGGAGNVVANLRGLGIEAIPVGTVGDDPAGREIRDRLERLGCPTDLVVEVPGRPTTRKTRVIARHQQVVRIDRERPSPPRSPLQDRLLEVGRRGLSAAGVCILSDYGKGVCSPRVTRSVLETAGRRSVPVLVDPKGRDFDKYRGAACITPNLDEAARVVSLSGADDESVTEAARAIAERYGIEHVLLTRSAQGMTLHTPTGTHHFRARARDVYDVSGAGDTVMAAVAGSVASGLDYRDAAVVANAAAGIVVGKLGTVPVDREELEGEAMLASSPAGGGTVVPLLEYLARGREHRGEAGRVALVDGFIGAVDRRTVDVLRRAADLADVLLVPSPGDGASPDSVGGDAPVDPAVLASLEMVDAVLVLDGKRTEDHLRRLRPDVLVRSDRFLAGSSPLSDGDPSSRRIVEISMNPEG